MAGTDVPATRVTRAFSIIEGLVAAANRDNPADLEVTLHLVAAVASVATEQLSLEGQ